MSLPICEQCCEKPIKRARVNGRPCRYCSLKCYGAAQRLKTLASRPMCRSCRERRVSKARGLYCGKSCDMLDRRRSNPGFEQKRRAGWAKAMVRMREGHVERLRHRLEACFQAVFDAHPEWTAADRMAVLKGALTVHRQAYENGWKARDTRARRKTAA